MDIIMTFEPSGAGQTLADVRLPYSHESRQVDSAQAAPSRAPSTRRGLRVCGLAAGAGAGSRQTARGGPVPGRDSETAAVCRSSPLRLSGSLRVGARRSSYEETGCTFWAGRCRWGCEDHAVTVAHDRLLPWSWLVMWMGDWLCAGGKAGEYPYSMFDDYRSTLPDDIRTDDEPLTATSRARVGQKSRSVRVFNLGPARRCVRAE